MNTQKSYDLRIFSTSFLPWEPSPSSYYLCLSTLFRITVQSLSIDNCLLLTICTNHFYCLLLIFTLVTVYPISFHIFKWEIIILSILGIIFLSNFCLQTFVFCNQLLCIYSMFHFVMTERFLGVIHSLPSNRWGSARHDVTASCNPLNNSSFVTVILSSPHKGNSY
jgi:hypothetical protein